MKKSLFFGILAMMLPMVSQAQEAVETEMQKFYVEPSQIALEHQGIFAFVEGQWIPVTEIHSDTNGRYVAYARKIHPARWICECFYNNYGGDATCKRWDEISRTFCGKPRPW